MSIENMTSSEIYCFNVVESTCVGMWECSSEPGWYWARYGIRNGVWDEIDGGLLTIETDDDGEVTEGYATLREAFEAEIRREGDEDCPESLFLAIAELAEAQFSCNLAVRDVIAQLTALTEAEDGYRSEFQSFLAVA